MKDVVLKVDGMTCGICEARVEKKLCSLKGVLKVRGNFNNSTVSVKYNENIVPLETIIRAIESLKYMVDRTQGDKKANWDKIRVSQLLGIGIIIFAVYFVINSTVGFNFIPAINENMGVPILFVIGLITSLHCIAMCGGINLSQCVRVKKDDSGFKKLKPSILYNLGRVISYTVIGGMVGAIGSVVRFSGMASGIVAVFAGLFMIIMALNMLNIFPFLKKLNPRMPKIFSGLQRKGAGKGPFFVGLLNGLMPCGPLQAMQIYALGTGSFFKGALAMFAFSVGTVPLMFGFGAISSLLSSKFTKRMMKVSAVLVMVLGLMMLGRGFNLSGINFFNAASPKSSVAVVNESEQVVNSSFTANNYAPIVVKKGVPVKWNILIKSGDLNGCNRTMVIPSFGISKELVVGNNIIEFTPSEAGIINYSCSMGMISSTIEVMDEITTTSTTQVTTTVAAENSGIATIIDNRQEVVITVKPYGYYPETVVLQKGIKTKIKFVLSGQISCSSYVVFPTLNEQLDLSTISETKEFIPDGDFSYSCGMGMYNGFVKVVDDIKNIK